MKKLMQMYFVSYPHFKVKNILNTIGALMVALTAGQITVLYEGIQSKTSSTVTTLQFLV